VLHVFREREAQIKAPPREKGMVQPLRRRRPRHGEWHPVTAFRTCACGFSRGAVRMLRTAQAMAVDPGSLARRTASTFISLAVGNLGKRPPAQTDYFHGT